MKSNDSVTSLAMQRSNNENTVCVWMICRHKLYHLTVANTCTCFTDPLTRHGKTKFATVKWYNLFLQIFQSQTCYGLSVIVICDLLCTLLAVCLCNSDHDVDNVDMIHISAFFMSLKLHSCIWHGNFSKFRLKNQRSQGSRSAWFGADIRPHSQCKKSLFFFLPI